MGIGEVSHLGMTLDDGEEAGPGPAKPRPLAGLGGGAWKFLQQEVGDRVGYK